MNATCIPPEVVMDLKFETVDVRDVAVGDQLFVRHFMGDRLVGGMAGHVATVIALPGYDRHRPAEHLLRETDRPGSTPFFEDMQYDRTVLRVRR